MIKTAQQTYIRVPQTEYVRLKRIQKLTGEFWSYFEHLSDVKRAREDVKAGRLISQKKFFHDLGI